jgi:hypothetical protein
MKTNFFEFVRNKWELVSTEEKKVEPLKTNLILCFGDKHFLANDEVYLQTKTQFTNAAIVLCSTAGQFTNASMSDDAGILVAIEFAATDIKTTSINIADFKNSFQAAQYLVNQLPHKQLKHILLFCDGSLINGSELVNGLNEAVNNEITISGGLAGDGASFESTLIGLNKVPTNGEIVAIGFYGNAITIDTGCQGGWVPFGLEKRITKSSNNILFELENENALDVYKKYLGEDVKGLPSTALLFPLSITLPNASQPIVRTILTIDEDKKTMTFAGDVPEGSKVRFMRSSLGELTSAAAQAASSSKKTIESNPDFALLISCVGRKLIMGNNAKDEVNAVINNFENKTKVAGFYSYGEIAPFDEGGNTHLHNQTMTITTFKETL